MKRIFIFIFLSLTFIKLFPQDLEPPVSAGITSDYGPRNLGGYDWHWGIDYGSSIGTDIHAVEGGDINLIRRYNTGGWCISIDGNSGYWYYFHLFSDSDNPRSGNWEAKSVYLVDPQTGQNNPNNQVYVFILWSNRADTIATKVLASYRNTGRWVRWGNGYIKSVNGNRILTSGSVGSREVIGPSGNSGGNVPAHLHLACASISDAPGRYIYDINPLYHIQHDNPNYTISILEPTREFKFYHLPIASVNEQTHERVRVYVNSSMGKDLDKAKIYLFRDGEQHILDELHLLDRIIYGGLPSEEEENTAYPLYITRDGNTGKGSYEQTGVAPAVSVTCGLDTMFYVGFNTKVRANGREVASINREARFQDGRYDLLIVSTSIRDNSFRDSVDVILDNFVPYVESVMIEQGNNRYIAYWPSTPLDDNNLGELIVEEDGDFKTGEGILVITLVFSEDMDTTIKPLVGVRFSSGLWKKVREGMWGDMRKYSGWTEDDFIPEDEEGKARLEVVGAVDLGGNAMDGNPRTIGYRDVSGIWRNLEIQVDDNYEFWINGLAHVVSTDPADNENNVPIDKGKVIIKFSKPMDENTTEGAFSIIGTNGNGVPIDSFAWEDSNKTMNVFIDTLDYLTEYRVTITDDAKTT